MNPAQRAEPTSGVAPTRSTPGPVPADAPWIELDDVGMTYRTAEGGVQALAPTRLSIRRGEFVVLLGPSGCGKTTMLRLIGGLMPPSEGSIRFGDRPLWLSDGRDASLVNELAMVFQEASLFPWFSVEENIAMPLKLRGVESAERLRRARELCELVGISGFERRWPRELSGGMRQRAAIARALSYRPQVLLMDEPFGALDAMTRETMNLELQRIWQESACTIVLVTHSISEAVFLADRVVLFTPRPGRIDRVLPVKFARPRDFDLTATSEFQGIVSALRHRLDEISGGAD